MKSTIVEADRNKSIIQPSDWGKKGLADVHLDAMLYCEFGCAYCSSDMGMHLKMRKRSNAKIVRDATGRSFDPHADKDVVITFGPEFLPALERQLDQKRVKPGAGKTLVYSQLTDGFSPVLVRTGIARQVLELLLEKTHFRIRVLTKSAVVGQPKWLSFFASHADRFVVGLSTGTLDADFARRMEARASGPASRIRALQKLQDAGVPTFGMLCPVFPQVLDSDELDLLLDAIRPEVCEHVWAEPYNERQNWKPVRDCYDDGSPMWNWMTRVFRDGDNTAWSRYATDLYGRIHDRAIADGWADKLRYLLYEDRITSEDSAAFLGLGGVLLQSKTNEDHRSRNPEFAAMQS